MAPTLLSAVSPSEDPTTPSSHQIREWVVGSPGREAVQGDKDELISNTKLLTPGNKEGAGMGSEKSEDEVLLTLALASLRSLFFGRFTDSSTSSLWKGVHEPSSQSRQIPQELLALQLQPLHFAQVGWRSLSLLGKPYCKVCYPMPVHEWFDGILTGWPELIESICSMSEYHSWKHNRMKWKNNNRLKIAY